jgi:hypothetical protein
VTALLPALNYSFPYSIRNVLFLCRHYLLIAEPGFHSRSSCSKIEVVAWSFEDHAGGAAANSFLLTILYRDDTAFCCLPQKQSKWFVEHLICLEGPLSYGFNGVLHVGPILFGSSREYYEVWILGVHGLVKDLFWIYPYLFYRFVTQTSFLSFLFPLFWFFNVLWFSCTTRTGRTSNKLVRLDCDRI